MTSNKTYTTTIASSSNINTTYTFTDPIFKEQPFNISLSWGGKQVSISLKDGNDVFKLANMFVEMLKANNIEFDIKTINNKKKKRK